MSYSFKKHFHFYKWLYLWFIILEILDGSMNRNLQNSLFILTRVSLTISDFPSFERATCKILMDRNQVQNLISILYPHSFLWLLMFCSLREVSMDTTTNAVTNKPRVSSVEQCVCPAEYQGLSCEVGSTHFISIPPWKLVTQSLIFTLSSHKWHISFVFFNRFITDNYVFNENCSFLRSPVV